MLRSKAPEQESSDAGQSPGSEVSALSCCPRRPLPASPHVGSQRVSSQHHGTRRARRGREARPHHSYGSTLPGRRCLFLVVVGSHRASRVNDTSSRACACGRTQSTHRVRCHPWPQLSPGVWECVPVAEGGPPCCDSRWRGSTSSSSASTANKAFSSTGMSERTHLNRLGPATIY